MSGGHALAYPVMQLECRDWVCKRFVIELLLFFFFFFFSSRRRHTRSDRDWSSDVCSSDLQELPIFNVSARNTGHIAGLKFQPYVPTLRLSAFRSCRP